MFRCSLILATLSIQSFGDEADQAMLLQTKHAVDKRANASDEPIHEEVIHEEVEEPIHHHIILPPPMHPIPSLVSRPFEISESEDTTVNIDFSYSEKRGGFTVKWNNKMLMKGVGKCNLLRECFAVLCQNWEKKRCTGGGKALYKESDRFGGEKPCIMETCEQCQCEPQAVMGRPFSTDGGHVFSTTNWKPNATSEWVPQDWKHALPTLHQDIAVIGEEHWRTAGEHEHASVASFARASLDLMRYGAPPDLLRDTHQAAMEEVRHAQIAFGLASSFKGNSDALAVSQFPLDNAGLSTSLDEFASKLLIEGCIGETSAVVRLTYAIAHVDASSPVSKHLITLRDEEAGHAALAWKSLVWAVSRGAKVPSVPEPQQVESPVIAPNRSEALVWAGVVPDEVAAQIDRSIVLTVVKPWMLALQKGETDFPAVSTASLPATIADAVTKGASKVQNRLQEVKI